MNLFEEFDINIGTVLNNLKTIDGKSFYQLNDWIGKRNQVQVLCPFHQDGSPSLGINKEKNVYSCFVCKKNYREIKGKQVIVGNGRFLTKFIEMFYLVQRNEILSNEELFKVLEIHDKNKQNVFLSKIKNYKSESSEKISKEQLEKIKKEKKRKILISELKKYQIDKDEDNYLENRLNIFNDFNKDTIKKGIDFFQIGYEKERKIITIPIFENWYLRGIYGRQKNVYQGLKYIAVENFSKDLYVFNIDEIVNKDEAILVEGPLNAIKLHLLGYKNVISLFGAIPSMEQIEILGQFKKINIWFDNDQAGENGVNKIKKEIGKITKIQYQLTEKDAIELNKEEIKQLILKFKS